MGSSLAAPFTTIMAGGIVLSMLTHNQPLLSNGTWKRAWFGFVLQPATAKTMRPGKEGNVSNGKSRGIAYQGIPAGAARGGFIGRGGG